MNDERHIIDRDEAARLGIRGTSADDPSGRDLAQRAHDAGAVEPSESTPTCDVVLSVRFRGDQDDAGVFAQTIGLSLVARADVEEVGYTVSER